MPFLKCCSSGMKVASSSCGYTGKRGPFLALLMRSACERDCSLPGTQLQGSPDPEPGLSCYMLMILVHLQTALLYPLELAATRLAADTAAKAEKRLYTGLLHCLQQTYYAEGPRGVHRITPAF